jgi:hypothetical protein
LAIPSLDDLGYADRWSGCPSQTGQKRSGSFGLFGVV